MIITIKFASSSCLIYHNGMKKIELNTTICEEMQGLRLDQALAKLLPDYSRARIQQWIRDDCAIVDGVVRQQRFKVSSGQEIQLKAEIKEVIADQAENIPLDIIYEDEDLLVVNKPPGLVVHPGAGNREHTLLNALLHHSPQLANLPRAGIIHRLDKDTSGLLIISKNLEAHNALIKQMQNREIKRSYTALVQGNIISGDTIDLPIGRHPTHRTKMAIRQDGKEAITHYRVSERYNGFTLLTVNLETGRTHQIRVHMAHIKHPLVGDKVYGGGLRKPKGCSPELITQMQHFPRQALHAAKLSLTHPRTQDIITLEAPTPSDIQNLLLAIQNESN